MLDAGVKGALLAEGRAPPKNTGLLVSVGDTGEDNGVELAMVPPTPVLLVGDCNFGKVAVVAAAPAVDALETLPVIEQAEGGTVVVGVMRAGLCGEPMAITKGMLLPEPTLSLR